MNETMTTPISDTARELANDIINSLPAGITFCEADYEEAAEYAQNALTAYGDQRAAEARPQWQPIETAPRDGKRIIVFSKMRGIRFDKSSPTGQELFYDQRPDEIYTHWCPLPALPKED